MNTKTEQQKCTTRRRKGKQSVAFSVLLGVYDFVAVVVSYFIALWLRFDFVFSKIDPEYWNTFSKFILFYGVFSVAVIWLFRLYRSLWQYVGLRELIRTFEVSLLLSVAHTVVITLIHRMPVSYYIGGAMI